MPLSRRYGFRVNFTEKVLDLAQFWWADTYRIANLSVGSATDSAELLTSGEPPTGTTRLSDWLAENGDSLGRRYVSELRRNYRG